MGNVYARKSLPAKPLHFPANRAAVAEVNQVEKHLPWLRGFVQFLKYLGTGQPYDQHFGLLDDIGHFCAQQFADVRQMRRGRLDVVKLIDDSIVRSRRIKSITDPLRKLSWRVWNTAIEKLTNGWLAVVTFASPPQPLHLARCCSLRCRRISHVV